MPRSRLLPLLGACALLLSALASAADDGLDDRLRLNQLQLIGSHNSYHAGFGPSAAALFRQQAPELFATLDYRHLPLPQQLDHGVRQLELDVYADRDGGRYAHPAITSLIAKAGLPADPPPAPDAAMRQPGFKVMHVQDVDQRSTCQPLRECLQQLRDWSRRHPGHVPLFVLLETKQETLQLQFPTVTPEPFDAAAFDALEQEILAVFPRDALIVPDQVRGRHATLPEALRAGGWPTLARARGKLVFLLDQRGAGATYLQGHPALRGRLLFTNAAPGSADAAFTECNECEPAQVRALVEQGYLVRTRVDAFDQPQPPAERARRLAQMLASGAQLLSTDFPPGEADAAGYSVRLPGDAAAHCDPVSAGAACAR